MSAPTPDPAITHLPHLPCTNPESEPGHDTCTVLFAAGPARWCHTHRSLRADCPDPAVPQWTWTDEAREAAGVEAVSETEGA